MKMVCCFLVVLFVQVVFSGIAIGSDVPRIAHVSGPAVNGEVVVLTGEHLDPDTTRVLMRYPHGPDALFDPNASDDPIDFADALVQTPELPAEPPSDARPAEILAGGEGWLQVRMESARHYVQAPVMAIIWVGNEEGWGEPYLVNRPELHWVRPAVQRPGEVVRVFGRPLAWRGTTPLAFLRPVGEEELIPLRHAPRHREEGNTQRWAMDYWLPKDLAAGEYEVVLHNSNGGPFGWSEPIPLTVVDAAKAGRPVVRLTDFQPVGDGFADDTEALEKAVAAAAGGGTLILPPGTFAISRTLDLPEDVVLRGAGRGLSIIRNLHSVTEPGWTQGQFHQLEDGPGTGRRWPGGTILVRAQKKVTLEDLSLLYSPAAGPLLEIGREDGPWAEDITLNRVDFESVQNFALREDHDYHSRMIVLWNVRRLQMTNCETLGPNAIRGMGYVEDSLFSQNRFINARRWRGIGVAPGRLVNSVFEDNLVRGDYRGIAFLSGTRHSLIAGNTVEQALLGGNAGETFLVESARHLYEGGVASADGDTIHLDGWEAALNGVGEDSVGSVVIMVLRGAGLGQWRTVLGSDANSRMLRLERPWRVDPDASSTVLVLRHALVENVFVNNLEFDSDKGFYLWRAGTINNVVDRHQSHRTLGITLLGHDMRQYDDLSRHETKPDLFNLIRDCRVHGGGGIFLGVGNQMALESDDGSLPVASLGNRLVGNEVIGALPRTAAQYGTSWLSRGGWSNLIAGINVVSYDLGRSHGTGLEGPPRIFATVLENNFVADSPVGVGITLRASGTLLDQQTVHRVEKPLVDHGRATTEYNRQETSAEDYTPERSPLR